MLMPIGRKICFSAVLALFLVPGFFCVTARAETQFSILVTSNLQGKFSLNTENQETTDPLLILSQNIIAERHNGIDLYLDMGNALYPGVLAKYSTGSIMVDFLEYFSCAAFLVSSKDLQIGTKNLEFMQKDKRVRFLSANIAQDGKPIFTSWFAQDLAGTKIAFLGISSRKVGFDVPEKELYGYSLIEEKETLTARLSEIRAAGIKHIILLSGQTLQETAQLLDSYPEINMALCGGDFTDQFLAGKASRLDLVDGRSIVMAGEDAAYYRLNLIVDDGVKLQSFESRQAHPVPTRNYWYQEFRNRLTLWKEKFREDEDRLVAKLSDTEYVVDDVHFGQLLRDRFNCELGVVEANTINQVSVKQALKHADFLSMVNRNYNIFVITLTGDEIVAVGRQREQLVIAGLETDTTILVQGTPLIGPRRYHVAATQLAMQKIQQILGREIEYRNTWMTVTDLLSEDLTNKQIVLRQDYDYLDRRFQTTVDVSLSNFIDNSRVKRGDNIETPPGQPAKNYNKWGLEDSVDITVYNKYHRFVLTPYLFYTRQDDIFLNNILRGTLLYDYNLSEIFKPYNKFRYDTVVKEVNGLRPSLVRETLGISAAYGYFSGKLGLGFEQQVQDPSNPALYGVELIVGVHVPFLTHFTYAFDVDTFTGILDDNGGQWLSRGEINNAISATLNSYLSLTFRHKYFYFNDDRIGESYRNSQFITSLDFKTDWKFW